MGRCAALCRSTAEGSDLDTCLWGRSRRRDRVHDEPVRRGLGLSRSTDVGEREARRPHGFPDFGIGGAPGPPCGYPTLRTRGGRARPAQRAASIPAILTVTMKTSTAVTRRTDKGATIH